MTKLSGLATCAVLLTLSVTFVSGEEITRAELPREQAVIVNHKPWTDTCGKPIFAHDGGVTRFGDTFYWYGISYAGNPSGKFGMMAPKLWNGVFVYSSTNLVDWTYRGLAVKRPEKGFGNLGTSGRTHVIYNEKTQKHVMWYWFHMQFPAAIMLVATADKPEGPFKVEGLRQVGSDNGFASDANVFKDDDGKAYLVYCDHETPATRFAPYSNGRYAIRIDSLTDDYLATNQEGAYAISKGCEAPAMIKHRGKYIVAASGVDGWAGTETYYAMASSPLGPYSEPKQMSEQKTWNSQITSLFHVEESDTLVAMCDQWWTPDKKDLNKSLYFWVPVEIDAENNTARMLYRDQWNPWKPAQKVNGKTGFYLHRGDKVMFLGNSITAMAHPEVEFIKASLEREHPELAKGSDAVKWILEGTPGWQAWQGLEKLSQYLERNQPTVCVIGYGTCEVTFNNQRSYVPAMKGIIQRLRKAGVAMTIVSPPPPSPKNWKQSFPVIAYKQGLPKMSKLARQIAEEEKIPFVDTQAAFDSMVKAGREFTTDGIHLNEAGYRVMADELLECWKREKRE